MALVRWQPRNTRSFGRDMDRVFDSFWSNGAVLDSVWGNGGSLPAAWNPRVDISETDEELAVAAEIPGMAKEDIKVTVANGILTIEGEKKEENEETEKQARRVERRYGAFKRSFRLPSAVDADSIAATYRDGVLKLSLPKAETAKTRAIEIATS